MRKSKTGLAFAGIYLFLVFSSAAYAIYLFNFAPANSELAGLPVLLLTLPWSMMIFSWLGSYVPDSLTVTFLIIFLSGFINAAVLYFVGRVVGSLFKTKLQ